MGDGRSSDPSRALLDSANPDFLRCSSLRQYHPQQPPPPSDGNKRVGIPPSHPTTHNIPPLPPFSRVPSSSPSHSHTRSLSQPSFFNFDCFPPISSSRDFFPDDRDDAAPPSPFSRGNPSHRRSNSDIPFLNSLALSSPSLIPTPPSVGFGIFDRSAASGRKDAGSSKPAQLVKEESSWERANYGRKEGMGEHKSEGEVVDDLFSAYMNWDGINALSCSGTDERSGNETREDLDSRASGTKTNGDSSDNEAESSINQSVDRVQGNGSSSQKREGTKRRAAGDIALYITVFAE